MLNRRAAMGAAVGGVLAGPQIVLEVGQATVAGQISMPGDYPNYPGAMQGKTQSLRQHLLERKARIERDLRGERDEDENEDWPGPPSDGVTAGYLSIDSLRSVANQHKAAMQRERYLRIAEEGRRWHLNRELKSIAKQLLGL